MTIGILGGLGPLAGAAFYRRLIERTDAILDAEHISVILSGNTQIPDRTAYILGESEENPAPYLVRDAKRLEDAGADLLVLLCHTAHAFLPELRHAIRIPILHMPYIALHAASSRGYRRVGILSTEGCYRAGVFTSAASALPLVLIYPTKSEREEVSHLIYESIKSGKGDPCVAKLKIPPSFLQKDVEAVLLGCTELSLLHPHAARRGSPAFYRTDYITADCVLVDPVEILAEVCIGLGGKRIKGGEHATGGFAFTSAECLPTSAYGG